MFMFIQNKLYIEDLERHNNETLKHNIKTSIFIGQV